MFNFRVVAVDGSGQRHTATGQATVAAGEKGLWVVTVVSTFDVTTDKIKSFVIQRRVQ